MEKINKKNFKLDKYRFEDQEAIDGNPALQDYLRVLYDQIKYENKMVGEFSIYGTYSIKPETKNLLKKEIKFFQERKGDVVYATRVLENVILNFKITFNIIGGAQQALLDLEERELRIDENNIIHKTRIAEIVRVNHPDFVNYVYKEWNVLMSFQDAALEYNAVWIDLIRKITLFNALCPTLGLSSITYITSMLALLPTCGPTGLLIANAFNKKFGGLDFSGPYGWKNALGAKRFLDQLMRKHNFFPVLSGRKEFVPICKDFVKPLKTLDMPKNKLQKKDISLDHGRHL